MDDVIYSGVFFEDEELAQLRASFPANLAREIEIPHVTLRYVARSHMTTRPELYGQKVKVYLISYGNNGRNEGLGVRLEAESSSLMAICNETSRAHITLSVAEGAKPVNTRNLDFRKLPEEKRLVLQGYYGAYTENGEILKATERPA